VQMQTPVCIFVQHRRQCRRGLDQQYVAHRGPSICWTPITPTQSRVQHIIFINVIDCVVGAGAEQVYSGAVTCGRNNSRHQYPEMLYFFLKMHQNYYYYY